jgi:hypothetical protein
MKVKILIISAILAAVLLFAGTGTAFADGRDRDNGYSRHGQPVVVHPVHPRVVHRQPKMAYGRIIPYHHVYVHRRPVIVERAPVCAPVRAGWGFSIRFGF